MNAANGNGAEQGGGGQQGNAAQQQQQQNAQLAMLLSLAQQGGAGGFHPFLQQQQQQQASAFLSQFGGGGGGQQGQQENNGGAGSNGGASSIEDQILQRASALRAETLLQQQQQQAFGMFGGGVNNNNNNAAREQEALLARLGLGGFANGPGLQQQLDLGRLEEMERARRLQLALAMGGGNVGGVAASAGAPTQQPQLASEQFASSAAKENKGSQAPSGAATNEPPKVISKAKLPGSENAGAEESEDAIAERKREELKQKPGTVIVPCRARGMPMDHNFKTAYFVISEDAKHGEDLICSYAACRASGVKFKHCSTCMAPVAKRNFARRHDHNQNATPLAESELEDDMDESERTGGKLEEVTFKTPKLTSFSRSGKEARGKRKRGASDDSDDNEDAMLAMAPHVGTPRNGNGANVSAKRRSMWSNLLARRPRTKDPRNLSSWLNEVLTVSDLDFPVELALTEKPKTKKARKSTKKPAAEKSAKRDLKSAAAPAVSAKTPKADPAATAAAVTTAVSDKAPEADSAVADAEKKSAEKKERKDHESKEVSPAAAAAEEEEDTSNDTSDEKDEASAPAKEAQDEKDPSSEEHDDTKSKKEHDGFSGSFADWRDRKKGKKGISSLRK